MEESNTKYLNRMRLRLIFISYLTHRIMTDKILTNGYNINVSY